MPFDQKDSDKKVPTWDGDPAHWDKFKEKVEWFVLATPDKDKNYLAAKIAGNVTGSAWKAISRLKLKEKELICQGGVETLLKFLKEGLMENPIPEAGRHFRNYVYKFRREKGESMKLYTTRHEAERQKMEESMAALKTSAETLHSKVMRQVWASLPKIREEYEDDEQDLLEGDLEEEEDK